MNAGAKLTEQVVVRVEPSLREWLDEVSAENGRTRAQTIRWLLERCMDHGVPGF